jgi:hypothetical protein
MGFLLKIAIFAVVVYGAWTTARRWFGLFSGQKPPTAPPRDAPLRDAAPPPPRVVVEDTRLCTACGTYVSANAAKCSRRDCPQP